MSQHFKIICKNCNNIIAQCRCMSSNKIIKYDLCEECKKKGIIEGENSHEDIKSVS
jgi:hypothetical protein